MQQTSDAERCPLCEGPNECGIQKGQPKCWCFFVTVSPSALAQVPEALRERACLCRACATGKMSPAQIAAWMAELRRQR